MVQCCTARMPLLIATSAFGIRKKTLEFSLLVLSTLSLRSTLLSVSNLCINLFSWSVGYCCWRLKYVADATSFLPALLSLPELSFSTYLVDSCFCLHSGSSFVTVHEFVQFPDTTWACICGWVWVSFAMLFSEHCTIHPGAHKWMTVHWTALNRYEKALFSQWPVR